MDALTEAKLFAKHSFDGNMTDIGFHAAINVLYPVKISKDELKALNKVLKEIDVGKGNNSKTVAHLINLYSKLILQYQ